MPSHHDEPSPDRPFKDFGQFGPGSLDLRVFLQSEYWVDNEGAGHLLTSMSNDYRSNVMRMLLENSARLHMKIFDLIIVIIQKAIVDRDLQALESLLQNEIPLLYVDSPFDFIENTPLMKRLRELVPNGPTLGDVLLQEIQWTDGNEWGETE
jgi:hypothetical protein